MPPGFSLCGAVFLLRRGHQGTLLLVQFLLHTLCTSGFVRVGTAWFSFALRCDSSMVLGSVGLGVPFFRGSHEEGSGSSQDLLLGNALERD